METGRKKILVTGGTGLVGSRIIELLKDTFEFSLLNRSNGVDITNPETFSAIDVGDASILIHLAAKADVDGSEAEKNLGEESEAWKINVIGTQNVSEFCQKNNVKMVYISTDFVFNGEKKEGDGYTEEDTPNPINFYAETKYEGEKRVREIVQNYIILRIAYPYRKEFIEKLDFVRNVIELLQNGTRISGVMDQIICPTFIDDVAIAIKLLLGKDKRGIFHCVGSTPITPFDAIKKIAQVFALDTTLITPTTREEFYSGKAKRPFNLYLKNDKMQQLGLTPKTFEEGLELIK